MRIRTLGIAIVTCVLSVATASHAADPSAPDYTKRVAELAKQLADPSAQIRQDGEIGLELLPPEAFVAMQAEADDQSMDPVARKRLHTIVERERPWQKARLRIMALRQQNMDWELKLALDTYERLGAHDPKWDHDAREGIRLLHHRPRSETAAAARDLLSKAVAAGCDDPIVLLMAALSLDTTAFDAHDAVKLYERGQPTLMRGDYPAYFKVKQAISYYNALYSGGSLEAAHQHRTEFDGRTSAMLQRLDNQQLSFWPRLVKEGAPAFLLLDTARKIIENHTGSDLKATFDRIQPYLERALPKSPYPLVFKGEFYVNYAWQARGDGVAATVTQEGWKLMGDRLAIAQEALQKAYDMDPNDPEAPTEMLIVELGQGNGKETMEKWYRRAMDADPDNRLACDHKLYYLEPKWHGSEDEMLEFGRRLYAEGNWAGGLPFVLVDARESLSEYEQNPDAYLGQPEVWADIQRVYEPYLRVNPNDYDTRTNYCWAACRAGRWEVAQKQFEILGDHVRIRYRQFFDQDRLNYFRQKAKTGGREPAPATSNSPAGADPSGQ